MDLEKLVDYELTNVLTSLSSYKQEVHNKITNSNSYNRILKNILTLKKLGVVVGVSMVVEKNNVDDVYQTGKFVANLGVNSFYATPMSPTLSSMEHHRKLLLTKQKIKKILYQLVDLENEYKIQTGILEPIPHCFIFHDEKLKKFLQRTCSAGNSTVTIGVEGGCTSL